MAVLRICLAVSVVAILLAQGESTQLCGLEIEYSGFNPIEALQLIQVRQIQEFEKFRSILSQLKFQLKSEDYSAWKRCLKEFRKEKVRYIKEVARMKASFAKLVQELVTRKLDPDQYQLELQNLFQQFQIQFTPAVETFKSKIQYLFDTIRDDNRRKEWWSTVKTTQVKTENGQTTRTSLTQMDSGIGGQRTQSITKQSQSVSKALLGGSSNDLSQTSSFKQSKLGGSSGGYGGSSNNGYDSYSQQSNSGYDATSEQSRGDDNEQSGGQSSGYSYNSESESQQRSDIDYSSQQSGDYDSSNQQSSGGYNSDSQQSRGGYNSDSQQSSGTYGSSNAEYGSATRQFNGEYGSSNQQSASGYSESQQSGGYETQQRSGYGAVSKTKEVKQESATVTGSTVDDSGINFSNTQTRSGMKETYGTAKESYSSSSNGAYGRKRRALGLAGASVEIGTNVAGNAAAQVSGSIGTTRRRRTLGLLLGAGLAGAAVAGSAAAGAGIAKGMSHSRSGGYSDGYQSGSGGYQFGSGGYQSGSGGFQSGSGGYQSGSGGYQSGSGGFQYGSNGFQSNSGGSLMKSGEFQASSGSFEQRSSTVDNSGINYSSSSSGGYGRKRRGLGLAGGASVESATNIAGNAAGQVSGSIGTTRRRRTLGLLLGAGLAGAAVAGSAAAGAGIAKGMSHSRSGGYSDGYQSGSGGFQYGSNGFQSNSGGSLMKSGEFQASSGSFEQRSSGLQAGSGGYPGYSNGFNKESTRNSVSQFESGMEGLSKYGSPSQQLGSSGYESLGQKSISGYAAKMQQSGGYQSQQRSGLGVVSKTKEVKEESTIIGNGGYGNSDSNEQSGGYESQQRSGYAAVSKSKEVKEESAYIGKNSGTGSFSDNSDINFSNTQTRSGMKDTYGGYGRKRRNLGLVNDVVNVPSKSVL